MRGGLIYIGVIGVTELLTKIRLKLQVYLTKKGHTMNYILWVGGVDDYYKTLKEAKEAKEEWKDNGYDDVIIEKIN